MDSTDDQLLLRAFDPLEDFSWLHLYWTEGPQFEALAYADGAAVTSWPDEVGTDDLAQGTGSLQPVFRATAASNGRPSVQGDGTDDYIFVDYDDQAQPVSRVVICELVDTTDQTVCSGYVTAFGLFVTTGNVGFSAGTVLNSGVSATTNPQMSVMYANGASSAVEVDGTRATGNAGANALAGLVWGGNSIGGSVSDARGFLVGDYAGDIRQDDNWNRFEQWAKDHYQLPSSV